MQILGALSPCKHGCYASSRHAANEDRDQQAVRTKGKVQSLSGNLSYFRKHTIVSATLKEHVVRTRLRLPTCEMHPDNLTVLQEDAVCTATWPKNAET